MTDEEAKREARRIVGNWARSLTPERKAVLAHSMAKGAAELFSCFERNPDGKTWRLNERGRKLVEEARKLKESRT